MSPARLDWSTYDRPLGRDLTREEEFIRLTWWGPAFRRLWLADGLPERDAKELLLHQALTSGNGRKVAVAQHRLHGG